MNSSFRIAHAVALLFVFICAGQAVAGDGQCRLGQLRCEYLRGPIGVDTNKPRLSWGMQSERRGRWQTAYRIMVASSTELLAKEEGDLWDSGKVESEQSVLVEYAGSTLGSGAQCWWKVRVWDEGDVACDWSSQARFTIGLLSADDWKGQWIGMASAGDHDEPWFRKTFSLKQKPKSAIAYVGSIGYHELYVNGKRVGDRVLNPSVSDLAKRALYVTYDVADYLQPGENVIADTGVDCIEPLDPLGGVVVKDAKERIGHRVALMGGVHTVKLAQGTLAEVEQDIQRCLSEGAPGGGYILACGDMLPTETSREKVEAMMSAARSYTYYCPGKTK